MRASRRTLQLRRPLAVFDLETTGTDPTEDRIVELAVVRLLPEGDRSVASWRVHPGRPIPPAASAVHGLRDEDVADCPRFEQVADEVLGVVDGCDLGGFNVLRFDLPLLRREFERAGRTFPRSDVAVVDALAVFHRMEPRDLSAALRLYCGREHEGAHGAEADAVATADVLLAQVAHYRDLPDDVDALSEFCRRTGREGGEPVDAAGKFVWRGGEAVLAFGKHRNRPLRELAEQAPGYLRWMLDGDFEPSTKSVAAGALQGHFPARGSG